MLMILTNLKKKYWILLMALSKYTVRMIGDKKIKYRKNPPRDLNGKVLPTKKQIKARLAAKKRMKMAHKVLKKNGYIPGTKEYMKEMQNILKKNMNETSGKKKSRLVKRKAKVCRKNGKFTQC